MSNFNGAYDLSSLRKPANPLAAQNLSDAVATSVPSVVIECTEQNLREVLEISNAVPVIIEFHADSMRVLDFSARLAAIVTALAGRLVLARVDANTEQRVSQAFAVKGAPTLIAVIKGQPAPLFEGDQDDEAITKVLEQVLRVAGENGVSGVAVVDGEGSAEKPAITLPPLHQEAYDAIGRMDFDGAIAAYTKALNENPRDELAISGMAQVKLLQRTEGIDPSKLPAEAPSNLQGAIQWADVMASMGEYAKAFDALLSAFEHHPENRDMLRKHLLELFAVVDPGDPDLADARKRLSTLLY